MYSKSSEVRKRVLHLNGKWLGQTETGTQRYAREVFNAFDPEFRRTIEVILPKGVDVPEWLDAGSITRSKFDGLLFEQFALPWISRGKDLLSLGGSSPLLKRRQHLVLFDASVFRFPRTFSRLFSLWYKLLYRTARWRAITLFTISDFSRSELVDVLRLPAERIHVARCGADHIRELPAVAPRNEASAVLIGSLTERKNVGKILPLLLEAGVKVELVGMAGSKRVFGSAASDGWASDLLTSHGRVSDAEMIAILQKATALVFPSKYEGFGLPIVEAQRVGCAVVAADSSSLPEAGGSGAQYFNTERLADAVAHVRELARNPGLRSSYVAAGYDNARRFLWKDAARVIESEIVKQQGRSRDRW